MQQIRIDIPVDDVYESGDGAKLFWNAGGEGPVDFTSAGQLTSGILPLVPSFGGSSGNFDGPNFDVPVFGSDRKVGTFNMPNFETGNFDFMPIVSHLTKPLYFGDFRFGVKVKDALSNEQTDPPTESQVTVNSWPNRPNRFQHQSNASPTVAVFGFRASPELAESN